MSRARILVVDDKENMLKLFQKILGDKHDLTVTDDSAKALAFIEIQHFDLVITDMKMPGAGGLDILRAVKLKSPGTEVVMMTGYASVQDAVEAMKLGAYDYLQKPFDPDDAGLVAARAIERKQLKEQTVSLQRELQGVYSFHKLIGKSNAMQSVYKLLERAAQLDITVLVLGETGTGKELAARAIHYQSARREKRFVPVNCGALPADLVESELFGHARGAFTGAVGAKPGLFEEADGGTLFLDEIGDIPLVTQVKLNRAIQEKEIRRVGENKPIHVDVRIVAATHRDLKKEVEAGRFREDLFYRLNVFPIRMPPLRERREDIPLLTDHFLKKLAAAHRRDVEGFTPEALQVLLSHEWPGNVRELENALERAVAISTGKYIEGSEVVIESDSSTGGSISGKSLVSLPYRDAIDLARDRFSREYLVALLNRFNGNVTKAAQHAGVERESLHRLLRKFDVQSDGFKV